MTTKLWPCSKWLWPLSLPLLAAALSIAAYVLPAHAFDNGQYANVPSDIRAWFKGVKSSSGVPCCDIADGHRTTWRSNNGGYEVPVDGDWVAVPAEAVITDSGNPVGEAVVWYSKFDRSVYIRCFVPGGGA